MHRHNSKPKGGGISTVYKAVNLITQGGIVENISRQHDLLGKAHGVNSSPIGEELSCKLSNRISRKLAYERGYR